MRANVTYKYQMMMLRPVKVVHISNSLPNITTIKPLPSVA
jgi:hypothetical protein